MYLLVSESTVFGVCDPGSKIYSGGSGVLIEPMKGGRARRKQGDVRIGKYSGHEIGI